MVVDTEKNTILAVTVPMELREKIKAWAKKKGYVSESEFARKLLRREIQIYEAGEVLDKGIGSE